jgi:tRNA dimethylallyltransferase
MEYKHIALYLDGEVTYDIMVEKLRNDIYHLAKRQETWFRGKERRVIHVKWNKQANMENAASIADSYFDVKK